MDRNKYRIAKIIPIAEKGIFPVYMKARSWCIGRNDRVVIKMQGIPIEFKYADLIIIHGEAVLQLKLLNDDRTEYRKIENLIVCSKDQLLLETS